MTRKIFQICTLFILLLSVMLYGCISGTSQKSSYYVLNTTQDLSFTLTPLKNIDLGLGPVKLPGFLKRPQIVTRQDKNLLTISEFHRWGGSLEEQITGVMVENLSSLLQTPNVSAYPWEKPFRPTYQLFVDLRRFDGQIDDSIKLETIWWLVDTKSDKRLLTRRSSMVEPVLGKGYTDYVIALNTALEKLCREMAKALIESV